MADRFTENPMAEMTALARAVSNTEKDRRIRCGDGLAVKLLGGKFKFIAKVPPVRALMKRIHRKITPGGYGYIIARTIYFDQLLTHLPFEQLIILGAGFDSRAYRYAHVLKDKKVFEVDHPELVARKKTKLQSVLGRLPEHVHYVPVDFNVDSLKDSLVSAGYNPAVPALFLWEGVSMYLNEDAVANVLRFVARNSRAGSHIVFDYALKDVLDGDYSHFGAEPYMRLTREKNEPVTFGIYDRDCARFVSRHGLQLETMIRSVDLEKDLFADARGNPVLKCYGFFSIVIAKVKPKRR
ncbi:MAG: SAM-dependent methyltransferase [Leptospiraceae bacterium]|nr:SAM-dependent methyltransferase [Leptospiraceae bacterium]